MPRDVLNGRIRLRSVGCVGCAGLVFGLMAVPLLARADVPAGVDVQSLGLLEGALHACEAVDPEAAARLKERRAQITQGASEDQIARLRATVPYRTAYASITEFAGKVDKANERKFCSQTPAKNR